MDDILRSSAARVAQQIREQRLTAVEVTGAYLDRIAEIDGRIHGYMTVLADRARAQALARDGAMRARGTPGALHGVPIAIKDLMTIEGVPMTAGAAFLGREPAEESATVVRRLEAAGAVVLGTTTLHEFAFGMTSVNPHRPTPRNPWDLERVCGGSSGGSAAVLAARMAAGAVGTDTGGSIRIPAAFCGIVGLKPTFSRVSRHGVLPLSGTFDTIGPMTHCVEDAALMLEVMAGPDPLDGHSSTEPVPSYLHAMRVDPGPVAVGRLRGPYFEEELDPAEARAVDDAARALAARGHPVRDVRVPSIDAVMTAQLAILSAEAAAFHRTAFPGREAEYGPDVRANLDRGAAVTPARVAAAREVMARVKNEVDDLLRATPVLFGPMIAIGAPRIVEADPNGAQWPTLRGVIGRFTRLFNLTGQPAISLPAGLTRDGLPVAVQLTAAPFAEGLLLAVASRLEEALGWALPELPGR